VIPANKQTINNMGIVWGVLREEDPQEAALLKEAAAHPDWVVKYYSVIGDWVDCANDKPMWAIDIAYRATRVCRDTTTEGNRGGKR